MDVLARQVAGAPLGWWIAFHICAGSLLAADLLSSKGPHGTSLRQALRWALVWLLLALAVFLFIWTRLGRPLGLQFASGYLLEQTLSVDNLFLFIVIFRAFRVSPPQQHRVLTYGVLGAILMRAALLAGGITLLARFHWLEYLFGTIVLVSGVAFLFEKNDTAEIPRWLRWLLQKLPVAEDCGTHAFMVRRNKRWHITGLLLALLAVEVTDLVFALDSIPAVLALSRDYFVVYTSNILAVLSLRSLFPAVVEAVRRFRFLQSGVAAILCFVGIKMLIADWHELSPEWSLAGIAVILAVTIGLSLAFPKQPPPQPTLAIK